MNGQVGIGVGQLPAQREFKGFNVWTEVIIPLLQALGMAIAVDLIAGIVLYLVAIAGPVYGRVMVGLGMAGLMVYVVSRPEIGGLVADRRDWGKLAAVIVPAVGLIALVQVVLAEQAETWLWELGEGALFYVRYVAWVGPMAGAIRLAGRWNNELISPFRDKPDYPPVEPQKPKVQDRVMYVTRNNRGEIIDRQVEVRTQPVPAPKPVYTLADDLRSFVVLAYSIGLARDTVWLVPHANRKTLWPSGTVVTRNVYVTLVKILVKAGFVVDSPGGRTWAMPLEDILTSIDEDPPLLEGDV
jgi:hypothetical protein